jgi:ribosomal protein L11 methyltransferase
MKYYAYTIELQPANPWVEVALGLLSESPFTTIEETNNALIGYSEKEWKLEEQNVFVNEIQNLSADIKVSIHTELIPWKNWNEEWEKNFDPIFIDDWCGIFASFHKDFREFPVTIRINPKMSFGTGHHQTTELMLRKMKQLDFAGKTILDMGCGTGVLAIAAVKFGAKHVDAVDIESWSVDNTIENMHLNKVSFDAIESSDVPKNKYDIILANINKNVLIAQGKDYYNQLNKNGILLLSGILSTDFEEVMHYFESIGFEFTSELKKDNWICLRFYKS